KNVSILERKLNIFFRRYGGYEPIAEPDPKRKGFTLYKVRLKRQLPEHISEWVSDIIGNLRASLDHAIYSLSVARGGHPQPGDVYFPFGRTETHFERALEGRCKDIPELWPFIRKCKPYKGGNETLWALNAMRGMNEHAMVIPAAGIGGIMNISGKASGTTCLLNPVIWDSAKNEMEIMSFGPGTEYNIKFKLSYSIMFGDGILRGKKVGDTLHLFIELTEGMIDGMEAETRRLGFIK
ncbi:MAG: hypothetical protein WCF61_13605, partial [Terriglobales bacterium]